MTRDRRRGSRRRRAIRTRPRGRLREAGGGRRRPRRDPGEPASASASSRAARRVMAVVKADAYGHGMAPVARAARRAGAEWLGVALPSEALALRAKGDQGRCWPGCGRRATPRSPRACARASTCPCRAAGRWRRSSRPRAGSAHGRACTSRSTRGCRATASPSADWPDSSRRRRAQAEGLIEVEAIWSHLADADTPGSAHRAAAARALPRCARAGRGRRHPPAAAAPRATAAACGPTRSCRFDLVRTGIAMYGLTPAPALGTAAELGLVPAMTLRGPAGPRQGRASRARRLLRRHLDGRPRDRAWAWCRWATPTASRARPATGSRWRSRAACARSWAAWPWTSS